MAEKLKPCPFCGRKRHKVEPLCSFGVVNEEPVIELWQVDCKCGGMMAGESKDQTADSWNQRNG